MTGLLSGNVYKVITKTRSCFSLLTRYEYRDHFFQVPYRPPGFGFRIPELEFQGEGIGVEGLGTAQGSLVSALL